MPPFLLPGDRSSLNEELSRDRYYLVVSAYDPDALRDGKVSVRWQTRVSIDSIQMDAKRAWGYLAGTLQSNLVKRIDPPKIIPAPSPLSPAESSTALIPIDDLIPGATSLLTFRKAEPPY